MKKIYESPVSSWDEYAETLLVYALEEGEWNELHDILYEDHEDDPYAYEHFLAGLGLWDVNDLRPGALNTRFTVETLTTHHLVISKLDFLNI